MPVGQLDGRRGGHRCGACRKAHRRCDGVRGIQDCTYCRTRFMKCVYSPSHAKQLQIVQLSGPPPPKAIIIDSWRFTTAYFEQACGSLSPFAIIRSQGMVSLSQTDGHVSTVASLVGEVFLCRLSSEEAYLRRRRALQDKALEQGRLCQERMRNDENTPLATPLACGIMLTLIHILLFGNNDPCCWMAQASDFIRRKTRDRPQLTQVETDLIRLLQLSDVVNAVARHKRPWAQDFASMASATTTDCQTPSESGTQSQVMLLHDETDFIFSAMWQWAILQRRMIDWVTAAVSQSPESLSPKQKVSGITILCETTSLQSKLLQEYRKFSKTPRQPDARIQLLAAYSYWTLIRISQHLQHAKWTALDCDLPTMTVDNVHFKALNTLDCMDTMLSRAGLCVVVLLPVVFSMGHEMVKEEERSRVLAMLDNQESRGFELSGHFKDALQGLWGMLREFGGAVKPVDLMPCYVIAAAAG